MMKLTRTLLTVVVLLIAVSSQAQDTLYAKIDGIEYILYTSDMTASVTRSGIGYYNDVVIPAQITYKENTYTVTSIGIQAFYDCYDLTSITIPESVTSIGARAFYYCFDLTSVSLPRNLTNIGHLAFSGCDELTTITIPEHVASIEYGAFSDCQKLSAINVAEGNAVFCSEEGVLYDKEKTSLLNYPAGKSGDFTVPSTVTSIQACAFFGCRGLSAVMLPEGLTSIASGAFNYCAELTDITFPASVTYIDPLAFDGCYKLTDLNVSVDNATYFSEDGIIYNKEMTALKRYPTARAGDFTIPSSVTSIDMGAFQDCELLINIIIPSSVKSIGDHAFYNCGSLKTVNIGEGVESIGSCAFMYCDARTTYYSFCKIPPTASFDSFYTANAILYVPDGSWSEYRNAPGWTNFNETRTFDATGINDVEADTHGENIYYDLSGRRLSAPRKGLNIINGRKVMAK